METLRLHMAAADDDARDCEQTTCVPLESQQRRAALAVPHANRLVLRAAHDAPPAVDDDARDRKHATREW